MHPPDSRGRHGLVSRRSGWFVGAIVLLAASCATDPSDVGTESTPLSVPALETSTAAPETSADDEPRDKPEQTTARPDDSGPAVDSDPAVTTDAQVDPTPLRYDWRQVPIGAGGFVTGIISVPDGAGGAAMYARTDVGGAYRWDESAGHWEQMILASGLIGVQPSSDLYSVASLAAAPGDSDVVYAAVGTDYNPSEPAEDLQRTGLILRSEDGGRTWRASGQHWFISGNQDFRTGTERLAVDPANPSHVVYGSQREGLWRSLDGGASWEQVPLELVPTGLSNDGRVGDEAGVNFAIFVPSVGGRQLFVGVAHDGVYASSDGGETWEQVSELSEGEIPASPALAGDSMLFAINTPFGDSARLRRIDAVTSEVEDVLMPTTSQSWIVDADPANERRLVLTDGAVRDGHFWTSGDGGTSWTNHDIAIESPEIPWLEQTDLDLYMSAGRLMFDPTVPGRVWFAEGMGVWRTDDFLASTVVWQSASRGIEETVVSSVTVLPDGTAIATVADRQGFLLDSHAEYPSSPLVDARFASGTSLDFAPANPDVVVWIGAESHTGSSPDRTPRGAISFDGAATWNEMGGLNRDMFGGEVAVSSTDPSVIVWLPTHYDDPNAFRTDPVGLYVSHDSGASWTRSSVDGEVDSFHRLFAWFTRRSLAADGANGNFYLLSDGARMYVSGDGALTWTAAPFAPPCSMDTDCHVFGQLQAMPGAEGHLWASVALAGLYRSPDAGQTPWIRVDGIDEARAFSFGAPIEPGQDPALYVYGRVTGDPLFGLWRSGDLGESWSLVSRYPNDMATQVDVIAGDPTTPGRVYVGFGGNGVVVGEPVTP